VNFAAKIQFANGIKRHSSHKAKVSLSCLIRL